MKRSGHIVPALLYTTDRVPTFLELAGAVHPSKKDGKLGPLAGQALTPLLSGAADSVRTEKDWLGWDLFGNRAIRQGDWKLLNIRKSAGGTGEWELFNIKYDAGETRDLSKQEPAKRKALLALWDEYAKANGVILIDDGPYVKNAKPSLEQN